VLNFVREIRLNSFNFKNISIIYRGDYLMNHSLSFGYDDLVIACDESDLGSVNDLIDGGIEVNAASDDGMSVLSYASQQGNFFSH
jgi:ankyrin repeat protein